MIDRPKGIRVMAVLHLVLALGGIFRIVSDLGEMKVVRRLRPMEEPGAPGSLMDAYNAHVGVASMYYMVDILAAVILAGLLIVAAIQLFRAQRQGRSWSLAYAGTSIALRVGLTVGYAVLVHPKHAAFLEQLRAQSPAAASLISIPSTSGWWLGMLLFSLYPLWVGWYLRKEEVISYLEDSP